MALGGPFVPGLPEPGVCSPDVDARRAAYQCTGKGHGHRGEDLSKSTLALSPSVNTPDGVGDGENPDAGNQFPGTQSLEHVPTENGPPVPVSTPKSGMPQSGRSKVPQVTRAAPSTRSSGADGHEGEKAVNIYESGMYWRLLD